jgi:SAM-dependent methyltransferase
MQQFRAREKARAQTAFGAARSLRVRLALASLMAGPPVIFDRRLHARRLDRAGAGFAAADFLKRRAALDIVERLEAVNRRFPLAADLGARDGTFARALATSEAAAKVDTLVQTDLSAAMLARAGGLRLVADEERLPFAAESLDLVVSSLALHWVNDLVGTLIQIRRALRPDGLFIGAFLGGATLVELRACLMEAEATLRGGAGPRVLPFADIADASGLLQRAGFALPVADTDLVTVGYEHPLRLLADLRAMGETNALFERPRAPLTRSLIELACRLYVDRHARPDGRITASFEILTLTGWAPHPDQQKPLRPGSAKTRLADALHTRERPAGERAGGEDG